jgi:competence protein ComEC
MFDLRKIPMLRVVLPFFSGVLTGLGPGPELLILPVLILLMALLVLLILVFRWQRRRPGVHRGPVVVLLIILFFVAGAGTGMDSRPHDPGLPEDQWVMVRGEICGSPRPGRHSSTFDLEVRFLFTSDTLYRIHTLLKCYLPLSSDSLLPAAGETWNYCGKLSAIQSKKNPAMPDYRAIMGRKKCWYRFYISVDPLAEGFNRRVHLEKRTFNPARIRAKIAANWQGDPQEVALLKAVCLGDRSSLSEDIRQAYTAAGGMHLLAVSGLHVGLIWWVLQYLTGWMNLIFRKELQRSILVVGLLWFYACITGFSSSVCRAVTMFSFFSMGRMRGGQIHILNVILASAFLLVLIHPLRLLDVGFQLSYAAITGIVTIHPLVRSLLSLKSRLLRRIWEAGSVSLAAQFATAPLVIFYFHQLPLYAIVTSLVAVPMLSILIAVFVCSVPPVAFGILEKGFAYLLVMLARLMNRSMEYLSSLPGAVLGDLQLDPPDLLVWLLVMLLGLMAMHGRSRFPGYLVLLLLSIVLVWNAFTSLERRSGSSMVITHFRGASMLSLRVGEHVDHYCWYRDTGSVAYLEAYRELAWNRRIYGNRVLEVDSLDQVDGRISSCLRLRKGIWLVGADGINGLIITSGCADRFPGSACRSDFILLSGEPPVDCIQPLLGLEELLIVMDGSNRKWYKERILALGKQIYLTDQEGALVKRW